MKTQISSAIVAAIFVAGCAATGPESSTQSYPSQSSGSYNSYGRGTVDRIEVVNRNASSGVAGTVIGGIVGGLIGHQIGSGSGQTAATVAGAVGGAVAGNQIEKRRRGADETFRVTVRMDGGGYQTITQDNITDLRTGDRVRVQDGRVYPY